MIIIDIDEKTTPDMLYTAIAAAMLNFERDSYVCDRNGAAVAPAASLDLGGGWNVCDMDGIEYSIRGRSIGFISSITDRMWPNDTIMAAIKQRLSELRQRVAPPDIAWDDDYTHGYIATRVTAQPDDERPFIWRTGPWHHIMKKPEYLHSQWIQSCFTIVVNHDGLIDTKTLSARAGYHWTAGALGPANLACRAKIVNPERTYYVPEDYRHAIRSFYRGRRVWPRYTQPTPIDIVEDTWGAISPHRPEEKSDGRGVCVMCETPLYDGIYVIAVRPGIHYCYCTICIGRAAERHEGATMCRTTYPRTARELIEASGEQMAVIDLALYFMTIPGVEFRSEDAGGRRGIYDMDDLIEQAKKIERESTLIYIMNNEI